MTFSVRYFFFLPEMNILAGAVWANFSTSKWRDFHFLFYFYHFLHLFFQQKLQLKYVPATVFPLERCLAVRAVLQDMKRSKTVINHKWFSQFLHHCFVRGAIVEWRCNTHTHTHTSQPDLARFTICIKCIWYSWNSVQIYFLFISLWQEVCLRHMCVQPRMFPPCCFKSRAHEWQICVTL